jgi:hypothetical protein
MDGYGWWMGVGGCWWVLMIKWRVHFWLTDAFLPPGFIVLALLGGEREP